MDTTPQHDEAPAVPAADRPAVAIEADVAASLTYASFQNAVPALRALSLRNGSDRTLENLSLELAAEPPFLRARTWTIDRLPAGESLALADRRVELDPGYLARLDEAERGEATLRLRGADGVLAEARIPVRLLARDEWGGAADMAQLLPAFVMPNDPAVAPILRYATERLVAHGHSGALDGYQSGDAARAFLLLAAIYAAVAATDIHYAEAPPSFESRGQKIRRPSRIAAERLATCLDTTLLLAAAAEAAGLDPVVILFEGHAALGVWLTRRGFGSAVERDATELRKAIGSRELIALETTGLTHRPAMTLEAAERALLPRLTEAAEGAFAAAIDVRLARGLGITPLASHEPERPGEAVDAAGPAPAPELPLPARPDASRLPAPEMDEPAEPKPATAAGRIERWQRRLLDLTLRNRLLNFPDTKRTVPFLCPNVARLEDRLANGATVRIVSLPAENPHGERDAALARAQQDGRDLDLGFAADALERGEIASPLPADQLEARLVELYRQVRNDLAEGGANTLFLAVGFLRWRRRGEARAYRAPLLLLPVKLERRSAGSRFTIRFGEDEPRFNATLLPFLEREFDLDLPQFAGDLPRDADGVDVPLLLQRMRQAVREVPGMEISEDAALSTFSFAKYLMWRDLVERTEDLRRNRVVRHLIDTPEAPFTQGPGAAPFPDERELDRRYAPERIVSLLPADSSQTAASLAAAEGRDFVLVGPPGTGKSQTIANMIANCLANGRTVLFVAEKTAALDVVYRRLRENGLGHRCIELHSNKTDRRHVLAQLKAAWEAPSSPDEGAWTQVNERLRVRRDELNSYVEALHRVHPNGWTAYRALGLALRREGDAAPTLGWPTGPGPDAAQLGEMEGAAAELGQVFAAVERRPGLDLVDREAWSAGWQDELLRTAAALREAIARRASALAAFRAALALEPANRGDAAGAEALAALAAILAQADGEDLSIALDPDLARCAAWLADLRAAQEGYAAAEAELGARIALASLRELDVGATERAWRAAEATFWPLGWFRRRRLAQQLQAHAEHGTIVPARDLPLLRAMRGHLGAAEASPLHAKPLPMDGLRTDAGAVARRLDAATRLASALDRLRLGPPESLGALRPLLAGASGPAREAAAQLAAAGASVATCRDDFRTLGGRDLAVDEAAGGRLDALARAAPLLRDWTSLCRTRNHAVSLGLGPLVAHIEANGLAPGEATAAFRLGYARWWLPRILDADPTLRDFRRFRHENAVLDFREIDDLVRAQASGRVVRAVPHGLPEAASVSRNSELGLLRHQMGLQRPSQSIRDLIGRMPDSFPKLAPCMLMSPLSIAQYLPATHAPFDVAIFDEASQITTWDAVGAIARARQTVIVGDPKQLPPTNFFGRAEDEADEAVPEHERDLESILDEAVAAGIPTRDLRWHYRSRSESLIAFSNHHYYGNRLVTFPSPRVDDRAVRLVAVPDGVYDRGRSRTNRIEAQAVVAVAVARMRGWLELPERERESLGIITFNAQQQSLILDLLDAARRAEPALEWFFADERVEPTIVKNLENVQGDERDVILFSITFGRDAAGRTAMDFGAVNRSGGERRLNVAVTRARRELLVFSGLTADRIDAERTKATGVRHLKTFLDYAERGALALPATVQGSQGGAESPFEEAVMEQLERRGWRCVPQVGISGFRIDLGIRHPDLAGAYLAGVECDGASYHSSATARDRDKLRAEVLRGLGWRLLRVWSTDWWFDAAGCADRLDAALNALLDASRAARAAEAARGEAAPAASDPAPAEPADAAAPYRAADLSAFRAEPGRFFEPDYDATLRGMVEAVLEAEAPLRLDVLVGRIVRAHGWPRSSARIRERVERCLGSAEREAEGDAVVLWRAGTRAEVVPYRPPAPGGERRALGEIALAELAGAALAHPAALREGDPARALARSLGLERLAAAPRLRLDEAIGRARRAGKA